MNKTSPARERCYAAWSKTVPLGTDRVVFDTHLEEVKSSALVLLRRRGGLGATFGTLSAFTRCYDGPMLLAALQELLDAGEAAERAGPSVVLYVSTKPGETTDRRATYRVKATPSEWDEITHLLGTLRNESK